MNTVSLRRAQSRLRVAAALCLVAGAGVAAAHADVITSNFGANESFVTDSGHVIGDGGDANYVFATEFLPSLSFDTLSADVALSFVNDITLIEPNNVTAQIVGAIGGLPDDTNVIAATNRTGISNTPSVVTFTFDGAARIEADTQYWLLLKPTNPVVRTYHLWLDNNVGQIGVARNVNNTGWQFVSQSTPAFRVQGTVAPVVVPEAGTLALLLPATALAAVVARRKVSRYCHRAD